MLDKIKEILADNLGVEESEINLNSNLIEDLGADSLDIVELSMAVEDEFGVKIEDEDFEKINTVEDIIKYIEKENA